MKEDLSKYRKKRDFEKTTEPKKRKGAVDNSFLKKSSSSNVLKNGFVIHKHSARKLHYDLRLRIGNVLKSWAVPKGMPLDFSERRLAIETENHPLSYFNFSGDIPEGNYGAGKVTIWDTGIYENTRRISMKKSYDEGKIEFELHGTKVIDNYALIKTKIRGYKSQEDNKSWLLIKMHSYK